MAQRCASRAHCRPGDEAEVVSKFQKLLAALSAIHRPCSISPNRPLSTAHIKWGFLCIPALGLLRIISKSILTGCALARPIRLSMNEADLSGRPHRMEGWLSG